MKRFSEQFKKKSDSIRMRANERADLRDRLVSYMEYHPLPADMRTVAVPKKKATTGIPSEAFRSISINMHYLQSFAGVFALFLIVGVPLIAEKSVPGDILYPVKTNITEEVRASLTLSPYAKVEWETQRLERRVAEARLLASEGKLTAETQAQVAQAVMDHTDAAQQEIAHIREDDADEAAIAEITFASALEVQSEVLEGHIAQADEALEGEEGSSVVALASVINDAAGEAGVAQGQNTPSYEKLLGSIETQSTHAYELFESVKKSASEAEILDIERRLADVERKIAQATQVHDAGVVSAPEVAESADEPEVGIKKEEVAVEASSTEDAVTTENVEAEETQEPLVVTEETEGEVETKEWEEVPTEAIEPQPETVDSVVLLREALKDLQKLTAFMTDIDVRQTVTIEKLVPVVPTDQERTVTTDELYAQIKEHAQVIEYAVTSGQADEKIQLGYQSLQTFIENIETAQLEGDIDRTESLVDEALPLASDMYSVLDNLELPVESKVLEIEATTTESVVLEATPEEVETEDTEVPTEEISQ